MNQPPTNSINRSLRRLMAPLLLMLGVVALDQTTKRLVVDALGPGQAEQRRDLLGSFLALQYVENTGAAFGILRGHAGPLTALALVVISGLVFYYLRVGQSSRSLALSLGLLLGGALGNLMDRLRFGYVVDFVAVGVWPKFNVADSAITLGVAFLAWHLLRAPDGVPREARTSVARDPGPGEPDNWKEPNRPMEPVAVPPQRERS